MQDLLRLSLCRRNAPNYQQNEEFLKTCFRVNKLVVGTSLQYFNNNQRKSLAAWDSMKFFRIYVWIWLFVLNMSLNNNSSFWIRLWLTNHFLFFYFLSSMSYQGLFANIFDLHCVCVCVCVCVCLFPSTIKASRDCKQ